jgi:hypothetical protein
MGMDVYGKNPTAETGEYFRNNVWWWRPLWDYCLTVHGDLCEKVENGHSNDGDGLDAFDASLLSDRLLNDLATGVTAEYERKRNEYLATLPRHDCKWCGATGIRDDKVGVENGMPTRELETEMAIVLGRTHGWCNACNGEGKTDDFETNYGFSEENVREFALFLADSGGFQIW